MSLQAVFQNTQTKNRTRRKAKFTSANTSIPTEKAKQMPINLTIPLGFAPPQKDFISLLKQNDFSSAEQFIRQLPQCTFTVKRHITDRYFRMAVLWGAPYSLLEALLQKYSEVTGMPCTTLLSYDMYEGCWGTHNHTVGKTIALHSAMASYKEDALEIVKLFIRNFKVGLFHRFTLQIAIDNPNVRDEVKELVLKCREDKVYNDAKRLAGIVGGYSVVEIERRNNILRVRITVLLCLLRMRELQSQLEDETRSLWKEDLLFDRRFTKGTTTKGLDTLRAYECWESGGRDAFSHILTYLI